MASCAIGDIIDLIGPFAGEGGICTEGNPDGRALVMKEINGAIPLLLRRLDSQGTFYDYKVIVNSQTITLPMDCLEARQASLNGFPMVQRDEFYQGSIGSSQCDTGSWSCSGNEMIDLGDGFALPYDWPNHFDTRYGLTAVAASDAGKSVHVKFEDQHGVTQEEDIILLPDQQLAVTTLPVRNVQFIRKGQTDGAVRGYIYYPQTGVRVWMGTIPSSVSSPSYRKKKIPHCPCACGSTLLVKGKLRFFPTRSETDEIPFSASNFLSIGYACKSMYASRNGYFDEANAALAAAVNELNKELQDASNDGVVSQISIQAPWRRNEFVKSWC